MMQRPSFSTVKSCCWLYVSITEFSVSIAASVSMVSSAPPKSMRTSSERSFRSFAACLCLTSISSVRMSRISSNCAYIFVRCSCSCEKILSSIVLPALGRVPVRAVSLVRLYVPSRAAPGAG